MAENFYLDPAGLRSDSAALRETARRLSSAFTALNGVLDAHHGCWGTDDIGEAYAKNYVAPAGKFRTDGTATVDGLVAMPDDIDGTNEVFQSVDAENAARIDRESAKD